MTTAVSAIEDTRTRILNVAMELFAERGFAATSTRELSERLGFTKAALYYHFHSKDDLLLALVEPALSDLARLAEHGAGRTGPAVRRELLAGYLDFVVTHEQMIRVLSRDPAVARSAPLAALSLPLYDRLMSRLSGVTEPGTAELTAVRVALGGIHTGILNRLPDEDPAIVRAATLAAASGALGLRSGPGAHRFVASRG